MSTASRPTRPAHDARWPQEPHRRSIPTPAATTVTASPWIRPIPGVVGHPARLGDVDVLPTSIPLFGEGLCRDLTGEGFDFPRSVPRESSVTRPPPPSRSRPRRPPPPTDHDQRRRDLAPRRVTGCPRLSADEARRDRPGVLPVARITASRARIVRPVPPLSTSTERSPDHAVPTDDIDPVPFAHFTCPPILVLTDPRIPAPNALREASSCRP